MDILFRYWAQIGLISAGLLIATLEFFGFNTVSLWDTVLPEIRYTLGL